MVLCQRAKELLTQIGVKHDKYHSVSSIYRNDGDMMSITFLEDIHEVIEHIVYAYCPRAPTIAHCRYCKQRVCRFCLVANTGLCRQCWECIDERSQFVTSCSCSFDEGRNTYRSAFALNMNVFFGGQRSEHNVFPAITRRDHESKCETNRITCECWD